MKKTRISFFKKSFFTLGTTSLAIGGSIGLVGCGEISAADQDTGFNIQNGDVQTAAMNFYYHAILIDKYTSETEVDKYLQNYLMWYVRYQDMIDSSYWATQYGTWLTNNYVSSLSKEANFLDPNEFNVGSITFASGDNLAKDYAIVKKYIPTLYLQLQHIAIVSQYFKAHGSEIQTYFDNKNQSNSISKQYKDSSAYWLVKYIEDNKINLAWQIIYDDISVHPSAIQNTNDWNASLGKLSIHDKKDPFYSSNQPASAPYSNGLNSFLGNQNNLSNYFKGSSIVKGNDASKTPLDLDQLGGFLGVVSGSSSIAEGDLVGTNGFNLTDQEKTGGIGKEPVGRFGFATNYVGNVAGDGIQASSAPYDSTDWDSAITVSKKYTRTIVCQIINQSTYYDDHSSSKPKPYYSYDLSGPMKNDDFLAKIVFLLAVQSLGTTGDENSGLISNAREYYYNLKYQLHVYVPAIRAKLQGISNLLAND